MALTFTTAGESHGPAVIATLFGIPFGHALDTAWINAQLKRRQGGYGRGGRQNVETDVVEILSGLRRGVTIGSPLTLMIPNRDHRIDKAPDLPNVRPGHVDLAGVMKIGSRNARDVLERASARETAARVMAGAACQSLLHDFGITVTAHVLSIGGFDADQPYGEGLRAICNNPGEAVRQRDGSSLYTLDTSNDDAIRSAIDKAKQDGDTLGGSIEIVATGLPPGLGSHNQHDARLDGRIALALMSIQAMKGVEVGMGAQAARTRGSEVHDSVLLRDEPHPRSPFARGSNNAGGLEGGTTNGEPLVCRVHMKPISTLMNPLPSVDVSTGKPAQASTERSDTCAVPAAAIVAECAVAIVLAQALLEKTGGDSLEESRRNFDAYLSSLQQFEGGA
ncbi:MAG: chorismate synthase [Planctomycetota bacterium]